MKRIIPLLLGVLAVLSTINSQLSNAYAQGTAFTYQGRLSDGANPANGIYDLRFAIYDAASVGAQQGSALTNTATSVSNGLFTVTLDFGNQFPGANRWLEVSVRTNGGGAFSTLSPRQALTPIPYAVFAASAPGLSATGNYTVNLSVNSTNVLRITLTNDPFYGTAANSVGGSPANVISNGVVGGFIGGGGNGVSPNRVGANFASVLGGAGNIAGGTYSTAMGFSTTASGAFSTAMGLSTTASGAFSTAMGLSTTASGYYSTAMGQSTTASGSSSTAMGYLTTASGFGSTAMGYTNTASGTFSTAMGFFTTASGDYSTAMGRATTAISPSSTAMGDSTTASGYYSTAMGFLTTASGYYSTAMGFLTTASGTYSTAMGLSSTASGTNSTALGMFSQALHDNTLVWSDGSSTFSSSTTNQFCIQARGGFRLSDQTKVEFGSTSRQMLNLWSTNYGIGVQTSSLYFRCNNGSANDGFIWFKGGGHNDAYANAGGGTELMHLVSSGLYVNGALVSSSDRNAKENFQPVDAQEVLTKVAALPVSRWNYRQDQSQQHIGPMSQDFHAAFGVGPDDKHIATVDADGVALAAIQGLNQKLETENAALKARLAKLERLVEELVAKNSAK